MTDSKALAEKIYRIVKSDPASDMLDDVAKIESLLAEAMEEQRNRDHMPGGPCCTALDRRERAAYDRAAEVAEKEYWNARGEESHAEKWLAERIRALKGGL